jgi:hypothetical protein
MANEDVKVYVEVKLDKLRKAKSKNQTQSAFPLSFSFLFSDWVAK